MRSRKERERKSAVIGRVVVVSCRRFTTKARRHKEFTVGANKSCRGLSRSRLCRPMCGKALPFRLGHLNHPHNGEAQPRHCVELLWWQPPCRIYGVLTFWSLGDFLNMRKDAIMNAMDDEVGPQPPILRWPKSVFIPCRTIEQRSAI